MSRMYAVTFTAVAVTAQQDFFEINTGTNQSVEIHSIYIGNTTDAGDAQDEQLSVLIKQGATTSGSGGSAPTPVPLDTTDAAAGFTAEVNNTTKATTGTITTVYATSWNVRATPYPWMFTPEARIYVAPSERLTVELVAAPVDSITMSGVLWAEEIG